MSSISFNLRSVHQRQKAKKVTFREEDNPMLSEFAAVLPNQMGITVADSESIKLFNQTKNKPLVEGRLKDQVEQGDDVIVSTEGVAGLGG